MRVTIKIERELPSLARSSSARPEDKWATEVLVQVTSLGDIDGLEKAMLLLNAEHGLRVQKKEEAVGRRAAARPAYPGELEEEDEDDDED